MKRVLYAMAATTLLAAGCSQATTPNEPKPVVGSVTVADISAEHLSGRYLNGDDVLTFESKQLADKVITVTMTLHGLTLDATMDFAHGVQSLDGYSTADGVDTQMVEDDRVLILQFVKALEKKIPDIATQSGAPSAFSEMANVWAEWIPAMPLKFTKVFASDRQTSICYQIGSYQWKNHDCWTCSNGDGACNTGAYIGDNGRCSGDMWLWNGSSWYTCDDQNHTAWQYGTGNCFARCGEGCGSGTTYSEECAKHDDCVRNGHWTTSSWCSDELSNACWGDCAPCGYN